MSNYLRAQSAGEILRSTIRIYRRHFIALCCIYLLPVLPFHVLKVILLAQDAKPEYFYLLLIGLWLFVTPFSAAALTVGVSDICVGNRPSVARSLRRVLGVFAKLVLTNLMMLFIDAVAFTPVSMLVPLDSCGVIVIGAVPSIGLVVLFQIWWMFVPTVVVLERSFGWASLSRSKALGKGFYLRNVGIVVLLYSIVLLGWAAFLPLQIHPNHLLKMLAAVLAALLAPLPLIATVLLYYELRVRSESYDLVTLGQDLRR